MNIRSSLLCIVIGLAAPQLCSAQQHDALTARPVEGQLELILFPDTEWTVGEGQTWVTEFHGDAIIERTVIPHEHLDIRSAELTLPKVMANLDHDHGLSIPLSGGHIRWRGQRGDLFAGSSGSRHLLTLSDAIIDWDVREGLRGIVAEVYVGQIAGDLGAADLVGQHIGAVMITFGVRNGAGANKIKKLGPDLIVSLLADNESIGGSDNDIIYRGRDNGIHAFSFGTTACNIGDAPAEWYAAGTGKDNLHPVIGQNLFRLKDGRFQHIGQSWLKHSFCAVNETTCGQCNITNCDSLGIACADTYWATMNDGRLGGAKSDINPLGLGSTHQHPFNPPSGPPSIRGRLQVRESDLIPQDPSVRYFIEGQYVTHDELLHQRNNNASYREVEVESTIRLNTIAPTRAEQAAIFAWQEADPRVQIVQLDVPNNGSFYVGYRVTNDGNGIYQYEYAIQNLNSDRSARSLTVPLEAHVQIGGIAFADVDYHSGEMYDGADWSVTQTASDITWSTKTFVNNPNANALRWGTLYNFAFKSTAAPRPATLTLGLFKPGVPMALTFEALAPYVGSVDAR